MKHYNTMMIPREKVMRLIEKLSGAYINTDDDVVELHTDDFMFVLTDIENEKDVLAEIMQLQTYKMYSGGEKLVSLLEVLKIIGG